MNVTYGADYSARELSPSELDSFTDYDIRFLIRCTGWPDNPKMHLAPPGAHQAHVSAGRAVLLVAEHATTDPVGGFGGGAARARRALSDANSVGCPDSRVAHPLTGTGVLSEPDPDSRAGRQHSPRHDLSHIGPSGPSRGIAAAA